MKHHFLSSREFSSWQFLVKNSGVENCHFKGFWENNSIQSWQGNQRLAVLTFILKVFFLIPNSEMIKLLRFEIIHCLWRQTLETSFFTNNLKITKNKNWNEISTCFTFPFNLQPTFHKVPQGSISSIPYYSHIVWLWDKQLLGLHHLWNLKTNTSWLKLLNISNWFQAHIIDTIFKVKELINVLNISLSLFSMF